MRKKGVFSSFRRTVLAMNMTLLLMLAIVVQLPANNLKESTAQQSKRLLTGVVSDKTGSLPGVTVIVKGTTTGASTDIDGKYSLSVAPGDVLQFSFVGYKTQEVTVASQPTINVLMVADNKQLEEVVVVGYGTQKKVNLTGSIASVGAEEIKDRVNTDVLKAVQGTVPGVTIISRPGQAPSINFRGRGNLGTSEPLYVIDGAIADANFFSSLDPNSIESISFLKDAASSAIYGSRAAYGVVLVKTKGGKSGSMNITYNGYVGVKMPTYVTKLASSGDYATLLKEAELNQNPNAKPTYTDEQIRKFYDGSDLDMYPNTDWFDLVLNKAVATTQHSLNISGGSEKIRYFTGLGYVLDNDFMPGQKTDRYNLTSSVSADVNKWLTFNTNIKFIYNRFRRTTRNPGMGNFLSTPVTYAAQQSNGEWGSYQGGVQAAKQNMVRNPLRVLREGGWGEQHTKNTMIDLGFDIKPVQGLVLTGQFIYKGYDFQSKSYNASMPQVIDFKTGTAISGSESSENKMELDWRTNSRLLYNALARYDWKNDEHSINILAGMSYEHYKVKRIFGYRKNFPTNDQTDIDAGSNAPEDMYIGSTRDDKNDGGEKENKMLSYFGRVNYSLMDKYLLEANLRADASSRFYKDNRWGIFPSFSAGWRMNQENFLSDVSWINNLKLRASWGTLGNINNVGDYDYFETYSMGNNYNFENSVVNGVVESKPANTKLSWETVNITDIGVDFDIFDGKLSLIADYYIKNTNDILLGYSVPKEVGINKDNKPSQNMGKVQNKGIELALNHRQSIGEFTYSVGFNFTKNWNKVKDLGAADPMFGDDENTFILTKGQPIGTFYGYKTDGLLTQEDIDSGNYITDGLTPKAGDIKYVDVFKDGSLTGADRTFIGCDVPDITYGVNVNLQYKGIELSVFGQGVHGAGVRFDNEQAWAFFDYANPREYHMKRWTASNPNPGADYPRIYPRSSANAKYNQYVSDYWVFNANYFRIKNITLGYSFPKAMMEKCYFNSLKVYVTAENMFTIRGDKRMEDFDPESPSGRGLGALGAKSVALGVNLSF